MTNTAESRPDDWPSFAVTGDKTRPSPDSVIASGFPQTTVPPTRQEFNWAFNQAFRGVRYLLQTGVPDWAATEIYPSGAKVIRGGLTYTANSSTTGQDPASGAPWERWGYSTSQLAAYLGATYATTAALTAAIAAQQTVQDARTASAIATQQTVQDARTSAAIAAQIVQAGNYIANFIANETLAIGDMAVVDSNGQVGYAVDPSVGGSSLRPVYRAAAAYNFLQTPTITVTSGSALNDQQKRSVAAVLSNGYVVLAWFNTAAGDARFEVVDQSGVTVVPVTVVGAADATAPLIAVTALDGGGFVAAFSQGGTPKFAIYSNTGTVVKAVTSVDALPTNVRSVAITGISSGGFAIGYAIQIAASGNIQTPRYAVYDAAGTVVSAPATLKVNIADITAYDQTFIARLGGGGFVVTYLLYDGSNEFSYFKRFNNSGALQGAETLIQSTGGVLQGQNIVGLAGGGFATVGGLNCLISVYNSSGVLQGAQASLGTTSGLNTQLVIALNDGSVIAFIAGATLAPSYARYSSTGGLLTAATVLGSTVGRPQIGALSLNNNGFILTWSDATAALTFARFGTAAAGGITATTIASSASFAAGRIAMVQVLHPVKPVEICTHILTNSDTALSLNIFNGFADKATPVGVCTAAATVGNTVPVQFTGPAQLRLPYKFPATFNYQGMAIPGQKMSVVGSTVVLQGIQASNVSRQIN